MADDFHLGSVIVRDKCPSEYLQGLNSLIDEMVTRGIPDQLRMGDRLQSAVNLEFALTPALAMEFSDWLRPKVLEYVRKFSMIDASIKDLSIQNMWIVSQRAGEYNPLHHHDGDLSGILYLRLPTDLSSELTLDDRRRKFAGHVTFTEGSRSKFKRNLITFEPQEGELFLFPSDVLHGVYPFFSPLERRSLSFNITIKKHS